ncbi:MAG: ATP-binding cassette domain-containing protein [Sulfolobales archaeon]
MIKFDIDEAGYTFKSVLREIRGLIRDGEIVLIAGSSGSGKTTLLLSITGVLVNLLNGFVRGSVNLDGLNPLDIVEYREVPRRVGVVLQDPDKQISMPTPWDELSFTLENLGYDYNEIRVRVDSMLRKIGLEKKAYSEIENLSIGEKRRITLASALIHDPEIIFLDEPTASIDPWGVRDIRSFVEQYRREGKTIIIIEHKPSYFLDKIDRIVILENGKIARELLREEIDREKMTRFFKVDLEEDLLTRNTEQSSREKSKRREKKILEVRDLCVGYEKNVVLKDLNFELYEGEIVVLVGPNGSGKSTLLKTLVGWLRPLCGSIYLDGREAGRKDLIKQIFYTPQQPDYLFTTTSVEKEISLITEESKSLETLINELFPWYQYLRRESPFRLSHGQRRSLSLLISLSYNRRILLLDEPTTGLDIDLYNVIKDLIFRLSKDMNKSIIISTHDYRVIRDLGERVLFVDTYKKSVYEYSPEEILRVLSEVLK